MYVRHIASAAAAVLALSACSPDIPTSTDTHVDVLGSMMASASEIDTIFGTTTVKPKTALRTPAKNDEYEPISRPECTVVTGNAMDWVYRDSGYREFREVQLDDDSGDYFEVDQAVTAFDSPKAARALVTHTVDVWHRCAGDTLTMSDDGGASTYSRLLGAPQVIDGIDVTHDEPAHSNMGDNFRAIVAVDNLVVDLRVTGDPADTAKTVQLAKTIAGRNSL